MALYHLRAGEKIHLPSLQSRDEPRTSALVKTDRFETVQLVLHARDEISNHSVAGYTTFLCLEGVAVLKCTDEVEISAGDWVYLERSQQHSIRASEDCSLLMTIFFD